MFFFDEINDKMLVLKLLKGVISMTIKPESFSTSYINDFRTFKLNGMLRDIQRLTTDELFLVKKEIENLLKYEEQKIYD